MTRYASASQVLLVITSLLQTLLVLLHKGKGGGLSDMFGGGVSSSRRRFVAWPSTTSTGSPIAIALVWSPASSASGLIERFSTT